MLSHRFGSQWRQPFHSVSMKSNEYTAKLKPFGFVVFFCCCMRCGKSSSPRDSSFIWITLPEFALKLEKSVKYIQTVQYIDTQTWCQRENTVKIEINEFTDDVSFYRSPPSSPILFLLQIHQYILLFTKNEGKKAHTQKVYLCFMNISKWNQSWTQLFYELFFKTPHFWHSATVYRYMLSTLSYIHKNRVLFLLLFVCSFFWLFNFTLVHLLIFFSLLVFLHTKAPKIVYIYECKQIIAVAFFQLCGLTKANTMDNGKVTAATTTESEKKKQEEKMFGLARCVVLFIVKLIFWWAPFFSYFDCLFADCMKSS